MQSATSRIWTRVAVSISYDDNHYISGTSDFQITVKESFLFLNDGEELTQEKRAVKTLLDNTIINLGI